jgi:hypothetical protein
MLRRSDQVFPEVSSWSELSSVIDDEGAVFDRALGKILGQLGVPFAGLGGNGAMGSGSLFCSTAQIETLVRLHVVNLPQPFTRRTQIARKR